MNKYTELSDFEINKKVAYLFLDAGYYEINSYRQEVMYFRSGSGKGLYRDYDPCNNPSDAMQIIIENKITMYFVSDDIGWAARDSNTDYGELECTDKNYCRAAAILFLLMKDI
ncbi:MAG: phage protein NinX family protein [Pseudomonadota bacterium]